MNLPRVVRTFEDFIKVDIFTGDSDPVYWAIVRAKEKWGYHWASRFCVAMLAYYHTGTAVQAADREVDDFWDYLRDAYPYAPRASERRHFRGDKGRVALEVMEKFCPNPNIWFEKFPYSYKQASDMCAHALREFGPYFQLKVCDYMECLGGQMHSWAGLERNLPSEPHEAVRIMFPLEPAPGAFLRLVGSVQNKGILAAPWFNRDVGPAEVETSLCGWKTTKYKGNWFGADIQDKRTALVGYGARALQFMEMMPPVPARNLFKLEL